MDGTVVPARSAPRRPGSLITVHDQRATSSSSYRRIGLAKAGRRLLDVGAPLAVCLAARDEQERAAALASLRNPYAIEDDPGAFHTTCWHGAHVSAHSPRVVAAGSPADEAGVPAITVGTGARWLKAYQALLPYGRYVQGGGWAPLLNWVTAQPGAYRCDVSAHTGPFTVWDHEAQSQLAPDSICHDDRPGAPPGRFWNAGNQHEVWQECAYPGVPGHEPDVKLAEAGQRFVGEVMDIIRAVAPDAGSYVNEADYHQPDWQRSFWGDNYARLLGIKHSYDPGNLFRVHHGVGSEPAGD
jgi:hypothetical protein